MPSIKRIPIMIMRIPIMISVILMTLENLLRIIVTQLIPNAAKRNGMARPDEYAMPSNVP